MRRILIVVFLAVLAGAFYWKRPKTIAPAPVSKASVHALPGLLSASNENTILAINALGDIWGWGSNGGLQLAVSDRLISPIPVQVTSGTPWAFVHAGSNASYAINAAGQLWRRPYSHSLNHDQYAYSYENLRIGHRIAYDVFLPELTWTKVMESWGIGAGLTTHGELWVWREERLSRHVFAENKEREQPLPVAQKIMAAQPWADFCVGKERFLAVAQDGSLWKFDGNMANTLRQSTAQEKSDAAANGITLQPIAAKARFDRVRCWMYADHVLLLTPNGELWGYGSNQYSELGNGDGDRSTPSKAVKESEIVKIGDAQWAEVAVAPGWSVGIQADGSLWAWGLNTSWQLGTGDTDGQDIPKLLDNTHRWLAIVTTHDSAAALNAEGDIYTWGAGSGGRLADGGASAGLRRPTKIFDNQPWGVGLGAAK